MERVERRGKGGERGWGGGMGRGGEGSGKKYFADKKKTKLGMDIFLGWGGGFFLHLGG